MTENKVEKTTKPHAGANPEQTARNGRSFDPEMVYVECMRCGNPLLWSPGKTTEIIRQYGVDPDKLDAQYIILTDGCRLCMPDAEAYLTRLARIQTNPGHKVTDQDN